MAKRKTSEGASEEPTFDVDLGSEVLLDEQFCKLNIEDFASGREMSTEVFNAESGELQYDIYIRLSSSKYVKIANKGEDLSQDRIHFYRGKGARFLYMMKEDFRNYLGFNLSLIQETAKRDSVSKAKKIALIRHTSELVLHELYTNEINADSVEAAKIAVETATATLVDFKEAYDLIMILNTHMDYLYAQGVAGSFYAALIARQLSWKSPATTFKLSMAGLLRDIGKKEIDRAILNKSRIQLTPEELRLIESHPMRGVELLSRIPSVPPEILQIILQHHENCLGTGYPQNLKKNQIHPMARLVAVADRFAEFVIKSPDSPGIKPGDALDRMLKFYMNTLDPVFFVALMEVFKYPPPRDLLRLYEVWRSAA